MTSNLGGVLPEFEPRVLVAGVTVVAVEPRRTSPKLVVLNLASRKQELVYWVVLRSDPTVVPAVVWRLSY